MYYEIYDLADVLFREGEGGVFIQYFTDLKLEETIKADESSLKERNLCQVIMSSACK